MKKKWNGTITGSLSSAQTGFCMYLIYKAKKLNIVKIKSLKILTLMMANSFKLFIFTIFTDFLALYIRYIL